MKRDEKTDREFKEALSGHLEDIGFLVIKDIREYPHEEAEGPDLVFEVAFPRGKQVLLVETRNTGYPRVIREAANELLRHMRMYPGAYGVVAAPFISSRSAQILASEGIGYMDLAGNCRMEFGNVYIRVEGNKNPDPERRRLKSLFAPKASRIDHALLLNPGKAWKIPEMALEVRVSIGEVHKVFRALLDQEWAERIPEGFRLTSPRQLLDDWSADYNYRKNGVQGFHSLEDTDVLASKLAVYCRHRKTRFALALFSGAERLAPYTRQNRLFAYVEEGMDELREALSLKTVASGPNVTLMIPYDEGVFYGSRTVDGLPVASPVQLYLDLMSYRGRGEEAASFLREKEIEPAWLQKAGMTAWS